MIDNMVEKQGGLSRQYSADIFADITKIYARVF